MEQNKMEVLRALYKAQVEMAEAYNMCQDKSIKDHIWCDYMQLDLTVTGLEEELKLFDDEE